MNSYCVRAPTGNRRCRRGPAHFFSARAGREFPVFRPQVRRHLPVPSDNAVQTANPLSPAATKSRCATRGRFSRSFKSVRYRVGFMPDRQIIIRRTTPKNKRTIQRRVGLVQPDTPPICSGGHPACRIRRHPCRRATKRTCVMTRFASDPGWKPTIRQPRMAALRQRDARCYSLIASFCLLLISKHVRLADSDALNPEYLIHIRGCCWCSRSNFGCS